MYGSKHVPEFEKTAGSIALLHQLMMSAMQAEHRAQVMLEDTHTRTEEYKAKGWYPAHECSASRALPRLYLMMFILWTGEQGKRLVPSL